MLIRKDINYVEINSDTKDWGSFQTIKIIKGKEQLYITNIYSRGTDKKLELDQLLINDGIDQILTGDINAHHPAWDKNSRIDQRGKKLIEQIDELGLHILNTGKPTRLSQHSGQGDTAPDITILAGDISKYKWDTEEDTGGSDHLPQVITISDEFGETPDPPATIKFKTSEANWEKFRKELEHIDWETLKGDNSSITLENIEKIITEAAMKSIPNNKAAVDAKKVKKTFTKYLKTVSWWTAECQEAKLERKRLLNRYKHTKDEGDELAWKTARNKTTHVIEKAKNKAFVKFIDSINLKTSSKEAWQKLKAIGGKRNQNTLNKAIRKKDGTLALTDLQKANALAEHYEFVSSDANIDPEHIKRKGETRNRTKYDKLKQKTNVDDNNYYNQPITLRELEGALKHKSETSAGEDALTYNIIKNLPKKGKTAIVQLFNQIWTTGEVPQSFKTAIVVPIPKSGKDKAQAAAYRPISLTSHLGKTLETIVNKRLIVYLEKNKILTQKQSGFRNNREAIDQVIALDTHIRNNKMKGYATVGVFLDLEKAFDILDKECMLENLAETGITGKMYNYIQNFLENRTFKVRVGNSMSETKTQQHGTPQGAVLSPTLFSLAINNVSKQINKDRKLSRFTKTEIGLFADDTSLYAPILNCSQAAVQRISRDCTNAINHLKERGFKVNIEKTQAVHFLGKGEINIKIGDQEITTGSEAKYLGVTMDKELNYQKHINDKVKKGKGALNLMRIIGGRNNRQRKRATRTIYKCLLEPTINYGQEIYAAASKNALKTIDSMHNQALKVMTGVPPDTANDAVQYITNEPPPEIKRAEAQLNYWCRAQATEENPTAKILNDKFSQIQTYSNKRTKKKLNKGIAKQIAVNKETIGISQEMIAKVPKGIDTNKWADIKVDLDLKCRISKKSQSPTFIKKETLDHMQSRYESHEKWYTDGSVKNGITGVGVYSADCGIKDSTRITDNCAIMTAELIAIRDTLSHINRMKTEREIVILSDSLSGLQALIGSDKTSKRYDILVEINTIYTELYKKGKNITLAWIPSHCGIDGNEEADTLAANATNKTAVDKDVKLGTREMKTLIKDRIRTRMWQKHWKESKSQAKNNLGPELRKKVPYNTTDLLRLTLLRVNRAKFLYDKCTECDVKQTIEHVLLHCPEHAVQRGRLKEKYAKYNLEITVKSITSLDLDNNIKLANKKFVNSIALEF